MNVLVMTPWYPADPAQTEGLFVKQQVHALADAGCKVTVISPRPRWLPVPGKRGYYWRHNLSVPVHRIIDGIDVYFPRYLILPRGIGWSRIGGSCFRSIRRLIADLDRKHQFDVIHGHELLPVGLTAEHVTNMMARPFVLTVHGQNPAVQHFLGLARSSEIRHAMWEAIDRVAVVGTPLVGWVESLGCQREKVSVTANGAESIDDLMGIPDECAERFGQCRVLLSVSNLYKTKGVDLNLRALRRLVELGYADVHYVVIGDGPERDSLKDLAAELGLSDRVSFLGRLPHRETLSWMKACDVFSLPSWQEAFGIVYVEAMRFGKPVIGCKGQGAEDIISDNRDGLLVMPKCVDELVSVLRRIFDDPGLAGELGQAAANRALEFSWEQNARSTVALYQSVIERRPGASVPGQLLNATASAVPVNCT